MHKISSVLLAARQDRDLPLAVAAEKIGITKEKLSQLETDMTYLSDETLDKVVKFYGLDREFLLRLREKKV